MVELRYTRGELTAIARDFYERLGRGEFTVSRCRECARTSFPPREFCTSCGSPSYELVPHSGQGKLYAFTTQERGFRFTAPDVMGLVELEDGAGMGFGVIRGTYDDLAIGQTMRLDPVEAEPGWAVPAWTPMTPESDTPRVRDWAIAGAGRG